MYPTGRRAWSTTIIEQEAEMALGLTSKAADEEARAEVDVLNSRLEKTRQLNKKIQASLARLDANGKSMHDAIGPIYSQTHQLQTINTNIEAVLGAIGRIRQPSDIKNVEEDIIRRGPEKAGLSAFLNSVNRVNTAIAELKRSNLRSNQTAVTDLGRLLKSGNTQLETYFAKLLQSDSRPVEPLHFITKDKPFPVLSQDHNTRLALINTYIVNSSRQSGYNSDSPVLQVYASVRGPYLISTLQNLAAASVNTARKKTPDAVYRQGTNGIGTYAKGMEGAFLAEYDNICSLFSRDEWGKVFNLTCQGAIAELASTLRDLNTHIRANLNTDCYLAYEVIEIMSNLSANLENRTGELKNSFAKALKPIKETGKLSLSDLLDETRRRIDSLQSLPPDASAIPVTTETMTRLQTMVDFLRPISSIMISIGDGGWKTNVASNNTSDQIPSLASFDVTADGKQIFAHYCSDTIDTLIKSLDQKGKSTLNLTKNKLPLGAFLLNNIAIVDRMIRGSDLQPLLSAHMQGLALRKTSARNLYISSFNQIGMLLMDVQHTKNLNRTSGSVGAIDSSSILKSMGSKDKDVVKQKFTNFNTGFEALVAEHKRLKMEREVRQELSNEVQKVIEPLYCRYWDRYHEIDKGKGKYVKWNKTDISGLFNQMAS
ncbi:Cullin repeat-like-containing domain protein [Bisporella sp. PMI_857]|nr:Cullin repeat-like-containing domain protein [Bisporella sp. PMI_857]